MSYIRSINGNIGNNSINELNTDYTNSAITKQQMFIDEPVSQYDTEALNEYRSTIEQLRVQTESTNSALEAALVPSIFYGSTVFKTESDDKEIDLKGKKIRLPRNDFYVSNDQVFKVNHNKPEYVFQCNMIKFKSDRQKRLCYGDTIYEYTLKGDTIDIILKRLNDKYGKIKRIDYDEFIDNNKDIRRMDSDEVIDAGTIINTCIETTMYNLINLNYIYPFLGFLNGRALSWFDVRIYYDNHDTYLVVDASKFIDDWITDVGINGPSFIYLDIPFNVKYIPRYENIKDKYNNRFIDKTPIFWFGTTDGKVRSDEEFNSQVKNNNDVFNYGKYFERIYCEDDNIIYEEFEMDQNALTEGITSKFGILYNKRFTDFDYRFKIKRFNLLSFEEDIFGNGVIRDDFQVESHQFNILKITLDNILGNKRRFKIFYNTRVLYDQDNIFRIKNKEQLAEEFYKYMCDVSSNVQVFIDEVYNLIDRDKTDYYKLRKEIVNLNNMEESSTLQDEFIYYENYECRDILRELANQIFRNDQQIILDTINDLIDRSYVNNYNAVNPETGRTPKNEWFIRKHLPEMFRYTLDNDYSLKDIELLDEVFDFTYKDTQSYEENLRQATEYIVGYDVDKIESAIKRSVISITKTGKEIRPLIFYDKTDKVEKLTMNRWYSNNTGCNYVMIFKNGELYKNYNTIKYDRFTFSVNMLRKEVLDDDEFEFIFFLNVNNTVLKLYDEGTNTNHYGKHSIPRIKYSNKNVTASTTNQQITGFSLNSTVIEPENLLVLTDRIPDNKYNNQISTNYSRYELYHRIYSYDNTYDQNNKVVKSELKLDGKVNGLYRVSKQNSEEYFVEASSKPNESFTPLTPPCNITVCSTRQFRYYRRTITQSIIDDKYLSLPTALFQNCTNPNQFMIFVNGRIIPKNYVFSHAIDGTPIANNRIYFNIDLNDGDVMDIFYVPNSLDYMQAEISNSEKQVNSNNQPIDKINEYGYIKFYSYQTQGKNSKYSTFVFINGKKIPMSKIEDITTNMMKILDNQTSRTRIEVYNHTDTTDNDKVYIKDGLTHKNIKSIDMNNIQDYIDGSLLDDMFGDANIPYEKLQVLFNTNSIMEDKDEVQYIDYLSRSEVLNRIKENYVISGDPGDWIAKV